MFAFPAHRPLLDQTHPSWSRAMSLRQGWARGFGRIQVRGGSGLLMEQKSTQLRQLSKIRGCSHGPHGLQAPLNLFNSLGQAPLCQKSTQLRQLSKIAQVGSNNQTEHLSGNRAHGPPGLQARREEASTTKDGERLVGQPGAARIMNKTLQSAAT